MFLFYLFIEKYNKIITKLTDVQGIELNSDSNSKVEKSQKIKSIEREMQ